MNLHRDDDLVYETSRWQRLLWREHEKADAAAQRTVKAGAEKFEAFEGFARELFTRMYSEAPRKMDPAAEGAEWAERAHAAAEEVQEFAALAERCRGDEQWAGMAATTLAEQVLAAMPEPPEPIQDAAQQQRVAQALAEMAAEGQIPQQDAQDAAKRAQQAAQAAQQYAAGLDASALRQAVRKAVAAAQEQVSQAEQAMECFTYGAGAGAATKGASLARKREILSKVQKSRKLARIAELAGRLKHLAAQKQRTKATDVQDEVSDVVMGDDLARLLPSEAALLADDDLFVEFARRFLERGLLQYELKGKERKQRGPIVVCVDNSGSMAGEREEWSKAVALAMLEIARRQKRGFALVHFDGDVQLVLKVGRGEAGAWEDLVKAMEFFSGGGTDFAPPLQRALAIIREDGAFEKADVVLITDGAAGDHYAPAYRLSAQGLGAHTYGILIGGGSADVLKSYADEAVAVEPSRDGAALDMVFGI